MTVAVRQILLGLGFALLLLACGGGSGSSGESTNNNGNGTTPYGLTSRPATANLAFPITGGGGPQAVSLTTLASGFDQPIFATSAPGFGSTLALVEKGGQVQLLDNNYDDIGVLLDIRSRVISDSEQGLLGLAFAPDVASTGHFYVNYSSARTAGRCANAIHTRCSRLVRFTLPSNGTGGFQLGPVDTATEQVLLEVSQPAANHNGGMLAFGPDGYLYWALGDGGGGDDQFNNGQDPSTLLGNMLRLDVSGAGYSVPADNPFVGNSDGWREEIWALGLRNPWRFSFDRDTGELWLADVGQNSWEEINRITRGGNYGWPVREGFEDFRNITPATTPLLDPVLVYGRGDGVSVTGGYVYRGDDFPNLRGSYFYGDFSSGEIWAATPPDYTHTPVLSSGQNISSFAETSDGELLLTSYSSGTLLRLVETGGGTGGSPPALLSDTGLFANLSNLTPVQGLIEYDVNTPLWSDGSAKQRWIALPNNGRILFDGNEAWEFPVGTVIVKHFAIALDERMPEDLHKLETRALVHESAGWRGYTYRWNSAQTEAILLESAESETLTITESDGSTRNQSYDYPSRAQCLQCHTEASGFVLGLRTPQMNHDFNYKGVLDNQLRSFDHINLFTTNIGSAANYQQSAALNDTNVSAAQRARDYLDANCALCHRPSGPTGSNLDLRRDASLAQMNAVDVTPTAGNLGIANARIIATGDRTRSVLWERMRRDNPANGRMPPLASHRVDAEALEVIGAWIDGL